MSAFIGQIKREGKKMDDRARTDASCMWLTGWVAQWQTCMMTSPKRKGNKKVDLVDNNNKREVKKVTSLF
jgi:hypothetical protein